MKLSKLLIYQVDGLVYSFAYGNGRLIYALLDSLALPATESVFAARITRVSHKARYAFVEYLPDTAGFINLTGHWSDLQAGSFVPVQLMWNGNDSKQPKLRFGMQLVGKYAVRLSDGAFNLSSKRLSPELLTVLKSRLRIDNGKWVIRNSITNSDKFDLLIEEMQLLQHQVTSFDLSQQQSMQINGVPNYLKLLRSFPLANECEIFTNNDAIFEAIKAKQDLWQIDTINYDSSLNNINDLAMYDSLTASNRVALNNGANLEFANLNGIHVVDINSDTLNLPAFSTNYILADHIHQQICLRNLQGIILIDFIKNMQAKQQEQLIVYLQKLFVNDITSTKVLGFSNSGLCEIIRNKF